MSLPEAWTDRIFAKLAVTYGQRFLGLYAGIDLNLVKADWGHELSAYQQSPDAIRHALENLPLDHPPTVLQFRQLCTRAPQYAPKAIAAPAVDPRQLQLVVNKLQRITKPERPAKDWAHLLQAREAAEPANADKRTRMTRFQREAWREALKTDEANAAHGGASTPPAENTLPPGMRRAALTDYPEEFA